MAKLNRQRLAAPVGAVILILALIGAGFLCVSAWNAIGNLLSNNSKKTELEKVLLPVLMFDPAPFDSAETADPTMLLQSSIWAAVLSDTSGKYNVELGESLSIPETDVDAAAARLFGPNVTLTHKTFGELEQNYYYNESTHTYFAPIYTEIGYYIPRVVEIEKKEGDLYSLTVGYVDPHGGILVSLDAHEKEPDKYMIYDVQYNREKDLYYITALRDIERTADFFSSIASASSAASSMAS